MCHAATVAMGEEDPSPYINGIDISKIPRREYVMSSGSFVLRHTAHEKRPSMPKLDRGQPLSASTAIPVTS
jgi:hypothetical protein